MTRYVQAIRDIHQSHLEQTRQNMQEQAFRIREKFTLLPVENTATKCQATVSSLVLQGKCHTYFSHVLNLCLFCLQCLNEVVCEESEAVAEVLEDVGGVHGDEIIESSSFRVSITITFII